MSVCLIRGFVCSENYLRPIRDCLRKSQRRDIGLGELHPAFREFDKLICDLVDRSEEGQTVAYYCYIDVAATRGYLLKLIGIDSDSKLAIDLPSPTVVLFSRRDIWRPEKAIDSQLRSLNRKERSVQLWLRMVSDLCCISRKTKKTGVFITIDALSAPENG